MTPTRTALAAMAAGAAIVIALSLQAGVQAEPAAAQAKPTADAKAAATASHKDKVEQLPCFGCHSLAHYKDGKPKPVAPAKAATPAEDADEDEDGDELAKPFSHTLHQQEGVGHCHVCHAFEGHFHAVIRKETCAGCH